MLYLIFNPASFHYQPFIVITQSLELPIFLSRNHLVYAKCKQEENSTRTTATCACSPGQSYPGLQQEMRDQQVKGGDSAPLLCSCETPPGVLGPVQVPTTEEGHGVVGASPEEGHEDGQRSGGPPLQGQAEIAGALQPGEEKALHGRYSSLPVPEGGLQES